MPVRTSAAGRRANRRVPADAWVYSERARGSRGGGSCFAARGRLAAGAGVRARWLLAWLRPLIVRGRPSTVNGAAHLFPPANSAAGKRRPCGPPLTAEPLRPLGQKPSGQAQGLPPRSAGAARPAQKGLVLGGCSGTISHTSRLRTVMEW